MNLLQTGVINKPIMVLLVLSDDHITGATGKTLTITRSKNGAAFGAFAGSVTERGDGWYALTPAAGDVDMLGELALHITASDTDPADAKYTVVAFDPYSATNLGLTNLDATISSVLTAIGAIDFSGIPAAVWDYATSALTTAGSIGEYLLAKLGLLTQGAVTYTAPVDPITQTLTIVRGDDYTTASGRTLPTWEDADWAVLDLSAATSVTFKAETRYSSTVFTKAMDILSDTEVRLQLTDAETAALAVGTNAYNYDLEAVLSVAKGSDIVTLARGKMSVIEDVR